MYFLRKSQVEDLATIMSFIKMAQKYFASQHIDQWQDGYPDEERILSDIKAGESYIVEDDQQNKIATAMFSFRPEPTYKNIEGQWITDTNNSYGVAHRIAVSNTEKGKGIAEFVLQEAFKKAQAKQCKSFRIDTHKDNIAMQKLLQRMNFSYCGIIFLEDCATRMAFEYIFKTK